MSVSQSSKRSSSSGRSMQDEVYDPNVLHIHNIVNIEGNIDSPIDINLSHSTPLLLPPLIWHHQNLVPKKMKLTNSGHTVILSGKWHQERPYLSGGPLMGNYVFSQLHFHWGANNMEGSEHTVDGGKMPMEMHIVLFKSCYLTQEAALKKRDGVSVLVYFFKGFPNPAIQVLIDNFCNIQKPHSSIKLMPPLPLSMLFKSFTDDFFLYWGTVTTSTCVHSILWLLCRHAVGISVEQMSQFRTLLDINEEPLLRNFRSLSDISKQTSYHIYHISPSKSLYSTLFEYPPEILHTTIRKSSVQNFNCNTIRTASPFHYNIKNSNETLSHSTKNEKVQNKNKKKIPIQTFS